MKYFLITLFVFSITITSSFADNGIISKLEKVSGLTFKEITSQEPGYRLFEMKFSQPLDHKNPNGEWFEQRLVLYHTGEDRPMVLQTSGYLIFKIELSGVARAYRTNQIQVEHRFFGNSVKTKEWNKLTIEQSANDFHRIVENFKTIYDQKWLNTGASKGGMTSVYHRRFFPNDLDGTLALVAPLSFQWDDPRYIKFVTETAGGDEFKTCREKLEASQKILLSHPEVALKDVEGTFTQLGSKEIALEHAVIEMPFTFWQYGKPESLCTNVPNESDDVETHAAFLKKTNDVTGLSDEEVLDFIPYFYQAAVQLGSPGSRLDHLRPLLKHEDTYKVTTYTPKGVEINFDPEAMRDIADWVSKYSEKIMFIYGEFDPWSAGAFVPRANSQSYRYFVPKGNHGSNVFLLPKALKKEATDHLSEWLNVPMDTNAVIGKSGNTLEEAEFAIRKKYHLH